jgi:mono/diheme cytochrome c family protein
MILSMTRLTRTLAILAGALCASTTFAAAADVTFTKDVAPILFANCASCHRPGEVAPFPLLTYKDAAKRADQLAEVTQSKFMPPWKAEPLDHAKFLGERRLTDAQVATLQAWAKAGAPEGDPKLMPEAPKFVEGWTLGEPDLIVKMPKAYTVKAEGRDEFRSFVIPIKLPEDKYVTAVQYRPGNPKIVHHALLFLDNSGKAAEMDGQDGKPGFGKMGGRGFIPSGGLGGWAPGVTPHHLPDGVARLMPKGSDLIIQTHFHPSGKAEDETSSVGLYFAKAQPKQVLATIPMAGRPLDIPAGEKNYKVTKTFTSPVEVDLLGITPHAHLLCKSIKVTATYPDGKVVSLIDVPKWDWNWQEQYQYDKSMKLPAGTKLYGEWVYDNSSDNEANPSNPPKAVRWGEQTTDEMALVFFQILSDFDSTKVAGGGGSRRLGAEAGALRQMLLKRFDKNKDGKLDEEEEADARKAFGR